MDFLTNQYDGRLYSYWPISEQLFSEPSKTWFSDWPAMAQSQSAQMPFDQIVTLQ